MTRMTSCRACGRMISADESRCPRCGAAILNRTLIGALGFVAILVIATFLVLVKH
jgi:RNA polymerase subunit RPABC4/transcription elongation factor Spt4